MRELHDDAEILRFLRRDPYLNLYQIGDLDKFFRPHARYFGFPGSGELESVFLLYDAGNFPVLLALGGHAEHLATFRPHLPRRFYAHVSPHLRSALGPARSHGSFLKMALRGPLGQSSRRFRTLAPADLEAVQSFYRESYPGNWFDARMLETGKYVAGFEEEKIVTIAGVHVYSPALQVAALGNIAVAPAARGKGWARDATRFLCRSLQGIDHVGLNVRADNLAAIRAYEAIGFRFHASYEELSVDGNS